jgi:sulfur-oxidizing protein SoxY
MQPALTRRGALGAALALIALPAGAATEGELDAAIREQVGDARIVDGGITLRAPVVAENGGQVPVTVLDVTDAGVVMVGAALTTIEAWALATPDMAVSV